MSGYGSYGSGLGRWAGAAVLAGACAVACGDGFKASDCKATRTCAAPPQGGEAGEGAGTASNNESGAGGLGEGGSMGGEGGAQLPKPECTAAVDCDNADATDGAEACVDGACRPGDAPPRVVAVSPAHEGKDAEPNVPVVIEFSEALNPDSLMSDGVQLLDGSEPVPGELRYANGVATFVPERALRLHGSYEVVVSTSVTDEAGIELVEPFRSTFTVRDGSWHVTAIPMKFSELAMQAPLTASGSVLLGWVGNGTNTCPVAAGWLELGADQITPTTFAHSASSCGAPLVAASGNSAVFAWNADGSSYLQQYRSSEWAKEATQATTNTQSWVAAVAASPLGVVSRFELASRVGGVRAQRTDEAGAWQPAREELVALDLRISSGLDVAFDAEGNGLAAFSVLDATADRMQILVARYTASVGKWAIAQSIPGSLADRSDRTVGAPVVKMSSTGEAMVVWPVGGWLKGSYYSPQDGWFSAEVVSGSISVKPTTEGAASLTYDGAEFVAAWFGEPDDGIRRAFTARYAPAEGWRTAEGHDAKPPLALALHEPPQVVSDEHGGLLLVWRTRTPLGYPLARRRFIAGSWEPIATFPEVMIPGRARLKATAMNQSGIASIPWPGENAAGEWVSIQVARFY